MPCRRWLSSLFLDPARDTVTFVHCVRQTFAGDYDTRKVLPQPLDAKATEWCGLSGIMEHAANSMTNGSGRQDQDGVLLLICLRAT